jgi:hypothetical protein
MLARPQSVMRVATVGRPAPGRLVVRVLGVRSALQGTLLLTRPSRAALHTAGAVDLIHAASMLVVAALPTHRRAALYSAGFASLSGALCLAVGHSFPTR